jgi:CheY-like chemotaxis protein
VAKILVADDNSNIQKMVGLALKDHGIEVVAVGNGEAAVRKIADIHPDLVLADVFMPVRNGYEVCKFVKEDKALAHIPVILLVGAFDPLDEQEAQRVGADGVLKKPFVPPDPLISMVKSALVRAGVAHAGFSPIKAPAEAEPAPEVAAPSRSVPTLAAVPKPFEAEAETESFVDEVPVRPAALKIESGQQPVAFGSLLETGAAADEEPAEVSTAPVTMERDWGSSKPEEEEEEEEDESAKGSWRRDAADESPVEEEAGGSRDFRSRRHATWTPTREKEDLAAAAEAQEGVTAAIAEIGHGQPAAPFAGEAWAAAIDSGSGSKTAVAEAEKPAVPAAELEAMVGHAAEPAVAEETPVPERESTPESSPAVVAADSATVEAPTPSKTSSWFSRLGVAEETPVPERESTPESSPAVVAADSATVEAPTPGKTSSWFSTPPNPWEAEAQKANQLASTWDAAVAAASSETNTRGDIAFEVASAPDEIEVVSASSLSSELPAAAVETVREEAAQVVEQVAQEADRSGAPADAVETVQDPAAHLDMDAVVAKVLARLSPGLLNDATRELLRPVVEAVIREELNARKL